MKNAIVMLVSATLLLSCSGEKTEDKTDTQIKDTVKVETNETVTKLEDPNVPPAPEYTGDHVVKYDNGITKIRGFFRFGKKHGTWTAFFPSGGVQSETSFDNGVKNGKTIVYYENGKVMYEGEYKNDQRSGTWKTYDIYGNVTEEKKY